MTAFLADLTIAHAIGVVTGFMAGLFLGREVRRAPIGYQDATGYHNGPQHVLLIENTRTDDGARLLGEIGDAYEWAERPGPRAGA